MVLIAGILLSAGAVAPTGRAQEDAAPEPPPGSIVAGINDMPMGPVCWAAIVESVRQIGLRCFPGEDSQAQATLAVTSDAMGAMFLERGWTPAQLAAFRRQMGEADTPTEELCESRDAVEMYRAFAREDPAQVQATTQAMLERPGPPRWGTCL